MAHCPLFYTAACDQDYYVLLLVCFFRNKTAVRYTSSQCARCWLTVYTADVHSCSINFTLAAHRAPELLDDDPSHPPGFPSDIWSLAAIMLHCLTGKPPFQGEGKVHKALLQGKPPGQMPVGLPQPLQTLLEQCFQTNPAKRPALKEIKQVIIVA